jgi:dUTP pyrophosphatase
MTEFYKTSYKFQRALDKHFTLFVLKLCVVSTDPHLIELYTNAVETHNNKLLTNKFMDSGFDLFATNLEKKEGEHWSKMNFQVKAEMVIMNKDIDMNVEMGCPKTGYYVYPRSSLSKTNLRLANSTGIIDSGYRGCLMGMFDDLSLQGVEINENHMVKPYDRVAQICAPNLMPMYVHLTQDEEELSSTERGEGGIGSTGK